MRRYSKCRLFILVVLCVALLVACEAPVAEVAPTHPATEAPLNGEPSTDLSYLKNRNPATVDNSDLPVTPTEELHITGVAPKVDIANYRLIVDGLAETSLSLTYEALLTYPTVTEVVLLICPGVFVDNAEWTGVPVTTLLAEAHIKPEASKITFHSMDAYRVVMSLEEAQQEGVFLAHMVNGQVLPEEHGYPLRLVVRGDYGHRWGKWIERIHVE